MGFHTILIILFCFKDTKLFFVTKVFLKMEVKIFGSTCAPLQFTKLAGVPHVENP